MTVSASMHARTHARTHTHTRMHARTHVPPPPPSMHYACTLCIHTPGIPLETLNQVLAPLTEKDVAELSQRTGSAISLQPGCEVPAMLAEKCKATKVCAHACVRAPACSVL